MVCPECNGKGETIYYVETDRDENTVTVEQRKGICLTCNGSGEKPQTNADRIRAMSDEELMQFLFNKVSNNTICSFCVPTMRTKCKCDGHCKNGILEWLKQPPKGE